MNIPKSILRQFLKFHKRLVCDSWLFLKYQFSYLIIFHFILNFNQSRNRCQISKCSIMLTTKLIQIKVLVIVGCRKIALFCKQLQFLARIQRFEIFNDIYSIFHNKVLKYYKFLIINYFYSMPKNFSRELSQLQPNIVFNQKKNFKREDSRNAVQTNSKAALVTQLQNILKQLPDLSDVQIQDKLPLVKDPILEKLQVLQKKANAKDYKQIQKLCMLAIGKRILNIELRKKKEEYEEKQQKKSQIQQFFRENRIKKFNYQQLIQTKLQENSLIVRPYNTGKGFIPSKNDYANYEQVLEECQFIQVIKQVNKIFFQIFSGKKKEKSFPILEWLYSIIWIPVLIFIVLIFSLQYYSFQNQIYVLSGILAVILISLTLISICAYMTKPNGNNQMQQTIEDTKQYFQELNRKNQLNNKKYKWKCPNSFMYLEVNFNCDIHNM